MPLLSTYQPPPLEGDLATEMRRLAAPDELAAPYEVSCCVWEGVRACEDNSWKWRESLLSPVCLHPPFLQPSTTGPPRDPAASPTAAVASPTAAVLRRECGGGNASGFSPSAQAHLLTSHRLPGRLCRQGAFKTSRAYIGQYSHDGSKFIAAFQGEGVIAVYDAEDMINMKEIEARQLRWTITDTALSRDGRHILYSSINSTVHLVDLGASWDRSESIGNVTDLHEALELTGARGDVDDYHTGVWSLRWAPGGEEVLAGTADCCFYLYSVAQGRTVARVRGHRDHVNAVEYMDGEAGTLIATGSDDSLIKVGLGLGGGLLGI